MTLKLVIDDKYSYTQFAEEICGLALQPYYCKFDRPDKFEWKIKIHGKAPVCHNDRHGPFGNYVPKKMWEILHITDIHVQNTYTPGSNANCLAPNCCRPDQVFSLAVKEIMLKLKQV